ncbi:hypothetical protein EV421DRAFT_1347653 [Armillaria borealis]|uniref:F-box domain-containing protein n=1 Tax=Armillaria borealis TaxID=47425 RepID=A0AA39J1G9_9AGAR|nr:hypothetical protein EV421DRAFT_1347653 [Armillaria borealis]
MSWAQCQECDCSNHHLPMHHRAFETDCISPSDLESLKHSNNTPLPAQVDAIRGMIAQQKEDLDSLDLQVTNMKDYKQYLLEQVTHVEGIIEELRQQHEKACSAIQEKQTILSPVRRLPSEVLSEIFLQMVDFPILHMVGSRTKELHLYVPFSMFSHLASLELSFPLLDKLVLLSRDISAESHCRLFGDAPKLRIVDVLDVANPSFSFELPFAQIRHFRSRHVYKIAPIAFRRRGPWPSDLLDFLD